MPPRNLAAALAVTMLEMAMFIFGMARTRQPPRPAPIAVRLVVWPSAVPAAALPAIETIAPSRSLPSPSPLDALPMVETTVPPVPLTVERHAASPVAKPRSPRRSAAPAPTRPRPVVRPAGQGAVPDRPTKSPAAAPTAPASSSVPPGGGTMGARAIYRPPPDIPEELRRHAMNVVAVARFRIAADGTATVELAAATGDPRLNSALLATLRTWRFFPAVTAGRPVAAILDIRIPIAVR